MNAFRARLEQPAPLLFDGGLGTQLQARGLPPGVQPEYFCLARPDVLKEIHADYLRAGADIILTATFGGTSYKLPDSIKAGMGARAFNRAMAEIARAACIESGRQVFVGGDIGPCGHFVKPLGDADPEEMLAAFREQAQGLAEGGVDLFVVETQFDLAEARLAVAAIREVSDLPVLVSMTFEQGVSLTGSSPEIFAATMRNMGVDALGVNCGAGPDEMAPVVDRLLACAGVPVMVEPNAGLPELVDGHTVFRLVPETFAARVAEFVRRGARLVGGCCGTGPEHIAALRRAVDTLTETARPGIPEGVALTSRSSLVRIGAAEPLVFIGERINPTGKKDLQAELQAGSFARAFVLAAEQEASGAPVLDVNVGAPLVDETVLLPALTRELVSRVSMPLSLDSANPSAIAAALPWYPGSALVNSINGDPGRMEQLGPLCRRWGAPFILLPLEGRKLPVRAAERIAIIERLMEKAEKLGIPRHLILVDVLALAVASKPEAAREGLATIRWCAERSIPTLIGLSNISFGLPARELINATFLAMAQGAGLNGCIVNPSSIRMNEARAAGNVLMARDPGAAAFVGKYAEWCAGGSGQAAGPAVTQTKAQRAQTVYDAILIGDSDGISSLVRSELASGADPFLLVRDKMIPAITEVGDRYGRKEYFLPQLLRSAETMRQAFELVRPLLESSGQTEERPVVMLATVEGDIHDIGKNIVGLLLGNHGFNVVDLGKDVKAADIVDAAVRHHASIIGLSALMTTTMARMEDTVKLVHERGLDMRIMVGGAVVTEDFAKRIGADAYAADAVEAVRKAQMLTSAY